MMLTEVDAGGFVVRGVSVGGIYTSLRIKPIDVVMDCGIAPRSFAGANTLIVSHGHADHLGSLATFLGTRMLLGNRRMRMIIPAAIAEPVGAILTAITTLQGKAPAVDIISVEPGQYHLLRDDMWVKAFSAFHTVPCHSYGFFRRIRKLRA